MSRRKTVVDQNLVSGEFDKAHDLAERLYDMQKEQADAALKQLTYHGETLNAMKTDVAVIKMNTDGLPARVLSLENMRFKLAAIVAAILFLVSIANVIVSYFHLAVTKVP